MAWTEADAEVVRQMIRHEGELINHRMSWLTSFQGLLFAALAFAWKDARELLPFISAAGALSSLSAFVSLLFAHRAILRLFREWNMHKPAAHSGPDVVGYMTKYRFDWLIPWLFLPVLFTVLWITIYAMFGR